MVTALTSLVLLPVVHTVLPRLQSLSLLKFLMPLDREQTRVLSLELTGLLLTPALNLFLACPLVEVTQLLSTAPSQTQSLQV